MPKLSVYDEEWLRRTLRGQHHVITREQALECGVPGSTVAKWVMAGGKWQKILPGVYSATTGKLTAEQRLVSALLYAGDDSVISGPTAIRLHRLRSPGPDAIDVLIPWAARRQSTGFVRVHRTRQIPRYYHTGPIRFAVPARAVVDAARWFTSLNDVRTVISEAVQKQACSVAEIRNELVRAPTRDTAYLRTALTEVAAGTRSTAEAEFRALIEASDLPKPAYNMFLRSADGTDIGEVDVWWAEAGVAAEVDSQEYHFFRQDWLRTEAKHSRMLKYGIFPHHFAPTRINTDWTGIHGELESSIANGLSRPRLPIVAFPPAS
jgi:hypothetical protein